MMLVIDDRFKLVHICLTQSIEILVFRSTSEQIHFHASNLCSGPCVQQNHSPFVNSWNFFVAEI
jgi:hypothetical protein